jgi:hypothetical protein
MEAGFGLDITHGKVVRSRWVKGEPDSLWWQGTHTSDPECRAIEIWRCTQCGFLESYAKEIVRPESLFNYKE